MTLLTPQLLRAAADCLSPTYKDHFGRDGESQFMCLALDQARRRRESDGFGVTDARQELEALLRCHKVSSCGDLKHKRKTYSISTHDESRQRAVQAIRFDFLNLLAHEMEDS